MTEENIRKFYDIIEKDGVKIYLMKDGLWQALVEAQINNYKFTKKEEL